MLKKILSKSKTALLIAWAYIWHALTKIGGYIMDFGYNRIYVNGIKHYEASASKAMMVVIFVLAVFACYLKFTGSPFVSTIDLLILFIAFVLLFAILKFSKLAIESNTGKSVSTIPNGVQQTLAEKISEIKNSTEEETIQPGSGIASDQVPPPQG